MAHHAKCSKGNSSGGRMMIDHDKRRENDNRERSNQNIDIEKTHLNRDYSLNIFNESNPWDWACGYAQKHSSKAMRDNAIILSMDVVHLPKNWEDVYPGISAAEFFEKVAIPFERKRYGFNDNENEVSAVVHYDETKIDGHEGRPHLHYKYVPITKEGKCSHKIVNCRLDLQTYHSDLVRFAREAGFPGLDLYDEERAQARKAALSMPDYKRAMEIVADAQKSAEIETDRLECLRRSRSEAEGRVEVLKKQINECSKTSPSHQETLGESRRRASELEQGNNAVRGRIAELRSGIDGLRERFESAVNRLAIMLDQVRSKRLSLFEKSPNYMRAVAILGENGIAVSDVRKIQEEPKSFEQTLRDAERSAAARNTALGSRPRGGSRGMER